MLIPCLLFLNTFLFSDLVLNPTGERPPDGWTYRCGVPFPPGFLSPEKMISLWDRRNQEWEVFQRPLAWWGDGSIRWLLLEFESPGGPMTLRQVSPGGAKGLGRTQDSLRDWILPGLPGETTRIHGLDVDWFPRSLHGKVRHKPGASETLRRPVFFVQEKNLGADPNLRLQLEVEALGRMPAFLLEVRWTLSGRRPRGVDDLRFLLGKKVDLEGKPPGSSGCLKGEQAYCYRIVAPRQVRVQWIAGSLEISPGNSGSFLLPGSSLGMQLLVWRHPLRLDEPSHRRIQNALASPPGYRPSRSWWKKAGCSVPGRMSSPVARWIRKGMQRFREEREKNDSWRDQGDYRLRPEVWANLEFDPAASLIRVFFQTGKQEYLDWSQEMLWHWRMVDQIQWNPAPWKIGLPAQHGPEHNRHGKVHLGHLWVQGLLLDYALHGNPRSGRAAREVGKAVGRLLSMPSHAPRSEMEFAWSLLALGELASFFPEESFADWRESLIDRLLELYQEEQGAFRLEPRMDPDRGFLDIHHGQTAGVLLAALCRIRELGFGKELDFLFPSLTRLTLKRGWRDREARFSRILRLEEKTGKVIHRQGNLGTAWEFLLFSSLARAESWGGDPSWKKKYRRWLKAKRKWDWPAEYPGNSFCLALRALPFLR